MAVVVTLNTSRTNVLVIGVPVLKKDNEATKELLAEFHQFVYSVLFESLPYIVTLHRCFTTFGLNHISLRSSQAAVAKQ